MSTVTNQRLHAPGNGNPLVYGLEEKYEASQATVMKLKRDLDEKDAEIERLKELLKSTDDKLELVEWWGLKEFKTGRVNELLELATQWGFDKQNTAWLSEILVKQSEGIVIEDSDYDDEDEDEDMAKTFVSEAQKDVDWCLPDTVCVEVGVQTDDMEKPIDLVRNRLDKYCRDLSYDALWDLLVQQKIEMLAKDEMLQRMYQKDVQEKKEIGVYMNNIGRHISKALNDLNSLDDDDDMPSKRKAENMVSALENKKACVRL